VKLTRYTDYSLRTLLYLALHPDRDVPVSEVGQAYRVSEHHLAKVARGLSQAGLVAVRRGRAGGLRLNQPPEEIVIGAVVRLTEDLTLLECFDAEVNTCALTPACALKAALEEARRAFLEALDGYTLADMTRRGSALRRLLPVVD
jgi:Rrf2 family transcriptional regulator, nitric oxide-sensitive transcriptional repressor